MDRLEINWPNPQPPARLIAYHLSNDLNHRVWACHCKTWIQKRERGERERETERDRERERKTETESGERERERGGGGLTAVKVLCT